MLNTLYPNREISAYHKLVCFLMQKGRRDKAITLFFNTLMTIIDKLELKKPKTEVISFREGPFVLKKKNFSEFSFCGMIKQRKKNAKLSRLLDQTFIPYLVEKITSNSSTTDLDKSTNLKTKRSLRGLNWKTANVFKGKNLSKKKNRAAKKKPNSWEKNSSSSGIKKQHQGTDQLMNIFNVLDKGVQNVSPYLEVKKVRISRKTRQLPLMINRKRQKTLAMRHLIEAAHKRQKKMTPISQALALEMIDAFQKQGIARKKRYELHKIAHANRTFLRYRWW